MTFEIAKKKLSSAKEIFQTSTVKCRFNDRCSLKIGGDSTMILLLLTDFLSLLQERTSQFHDGLEKLVKSRLYCNKFVLWAAKSPLNR